ncbi:MAG: hypothetical protein AAGI53_14180 [Planctomycetota bacterium]
MTAPSAQHDWRRDVLDLLYAFARRRLAVISILLIAVSAGLLAARMADPFYKSSTTVVLLPREKPILDISVQSASVETSEDAAKRSTASTLTLPPNPELYTTLIRSSEVTARVAEALRRIPDLSTAPMPTASGIRAGVGLESTEEGVIKISMTHTNPRVATAIVNELVRECEAASKSVERQLILQQAGFLGEAIKRAESTLVETRAKLADFAHRFGVSEPAVAAARSSSLLQTIDDTGARLGRELGRLLVHRTEADPTVQAIRGELRDLDARRDAVRASYCGTLSENEFAEVESEWRALQQDVTLRQDLLMSMRARHEVFTIRADQPAGNIAVLRPATVPTQPAGPSRKKFIVLALLAGGMLAAAFCVLADQLERVRRDPEGAKRLGAIAACFRIRRRRQMTFSQLARGYC